MPCNFLPFTTACHSFLVSSWCNYAWLVHHTAQKWLQHSTLKHASRRLKVINKIIITVTHVWKLPGQLKHSKKPSLKNYTNICTCSTRGTVKDVIRPKSKALCARPSCVELCFLLAQKKSPKFDSNLQLAKVNEKTSHVRHKNNTSFVLTWTLVWAKVYEPRECYFRAISLSNSYLVQPSACEWSFSSCTILKKHVH